MTVIPKVPRVKAQKESKVFKLTLNYVWEGYGMMHMWRSEDKFGN